MQAADRHDALDLAAMTRALALAGQAVGLTEPNPRVGCVILGADGETLGEGHTQEAGGAHAEVMALRDAQVRGRNVHGATAYVTLEPCAHHGRTPPCCDALIAAGLSRVVVALRDPFPAVAGEGLARLRAAGIQVEVGLLAEAARELNIGFLSRVLRERPFVRLKVAVSLDGLTALPDGRSQWITGAPARADGHAWRRRAGAVLTGIGTVRDDDPRLDVRLVDTPRQPLRVVVDSRLEIDPAARLLQPPGSALIYTTSTDADRRARIVATGAQVAALPADAAGKNDLGALLQDLARRGVNELHVEAGSKLNGSLVREGLVDEYLVYQAPKLLGQGLPLASFGPPRSLQDAVQLERIEARVVGEDLCLRFRPRGRLDTWLGREPGA